MDVLTFIAVEMKPLGFRGKKPPHGGWKFLVSFWLTA